MKQIMRILQPAVFLSGSAGRIQRFPSISKNEFRQKRDLPEEVRTLRQRGIRVAAVFMGENASVPDARTIYGHDLVRIQRMDQLAAAAGKLIQAEIRELSG